jgi:4-diphosphocytidyl-2-C-methyl-D-erythritol kinase
MQRIDLVDRLTLSSAPALEVVGFDSDTIVRQALTALARAAGSRPAWRVRLEKRIPVAAGLGGGSADAAAAITLANEELGRPLDRDALLDVAASVGSDVPFFLEPGPKLVEGAGERLTPLDLPQEYWILVILEPEAAKQSTANVYARFDALDGDAGFDERRARIRETVGRCERPRDLASLPPNDLGRAAGVSSLPAALVGAGAFRADLSGAGPSIYALFADEPEARAAAAELPDGSRSWIVRPVW